MISLRLLPFLEIYGVCVLVYDAAGSVLLRPSCIGIYVTISAGSSPICQFYCLQCGIVQIAFLLQST